ncbi:hypothetical protein BDV93DRAFT_453158 [Ceratobasidium sp. AG-I]|nr:hypothetical protein BDV93DRAFT_453158 [Ceratobasidium sp. AG-I]
MHMVMINLIPHLVKLWTQAFHDIDDGKEEYLLGEKLWEEIAQLGASASDHIPSSFGCRVPNVHKKKSSLTAEVWSIWGQFLAPVLLRRRFVHKKFYVHFMKLLKYLKLASERSITQNEVKDLRNGLALWVTKYERYYYQYNPSRLQTCPVNLHYLLHLADSIKQMGPVWCYWAFPMERYCSFLGAAVKSRRFPFANIARRIQDVCTLRIIRERYSLHEELNLKKAVHDQDISDVLVGCEFGIFIITKKPPNIEIDEHTLLLTPRNELTLTSLLRRNITNHLVTRFGITPDEARAHIPKTVPQWGRIQIVGGGDLIQARGAHTARQDGRDASYIRYEMLVRAPGTAANRIPTSTLRSFYGQLRHVFAFEMKRKTPGNPSAEDKLLLLAQVQEAPVEEDKAFETPVYHYKNLGAHEVVDASTIMCVVGRVHDRKYWYIIDRSGPFAHLDVY